jgi:molybdate transport repressor ModE-like protein
MARASRVLSGEELVWMELRHQLSKSLNRWKNEWYLDFECTIDDSIWEASNSFDATKGKFIAWCWIKGNDLFFKAWVTNKRHHKIAPTFSYDQLSFKEEEESPAIIDKLTPDGVDFDLACEHRLTVESITSRADKAGQMARLIYEGYSVAEASRKIGVSETTAWDLVNELKILLGAEITHGAHGYKSGCRCAICKEKSSESTSSYYQRHKVEIRAKQDIAYAKDPDKFKARTAKCKKAKHNADKPTAKPDSLVILTNKII